MTALRLVALVVVAVAGTAVVIVPEPLRQTLTLAVYGFALTLLFFTFQAPDVALSEIVVSAVGLPVIILAALRKIRRQDAAGEERTDPESSAVTPDRAVSAAESARASCIARRLTRTRRARPLRAARPHRTHLSARQG